MCVRSGRMKHWSSSYVAVLLLFSVISTLNKSWVVCSLTLGKVMLYTLVENLVRRPTVLLLMTLSESMSSKSFCNGANVSNYLRAFTFLLRSAFFPFQLWILYHARVVCCLLWLKFWLSLVNLDKSYQCLPIYCFRIQKPSKHNLHRFTKFCSKWNFQA